MVVKNRHEHSDNWKQYLHFFLYPKEDIMRATLQHTTRVGKISQRYPMRIHYKSRNPLLQRPRLYERYATDTIIGRYTSYEGYNFAQTFVGIN